MRHLWAREGADVKAVHRAIGGPRRITLNTVQSAMERLYRKGFLAREKVSHAYVYSTKVTREAFTAEVMRAVVTNVLGGKMEPVLSAFVDLAADLGNEDLERLERMIAERRAAEFTRR
jgi:predicted transcriptional regulator